MRLRLFAGIILSLGWGSFNVSAAAPVSILPKNRILLFSDYALTNAPVVWTHEGSTLPGVASSLKALLPGTNHYHATGWKALSCRTGSSAYLAGASWIPPKEPATAPTYPVAASNLAANLRYDAGARIESPALTNGVGTIYFEAINTLSDYPGQLTVEVATNMVDATSGEVVRTILPDATNKLNDVWETLDVLELNAASSNDFTRYRRTLNVRVPVKMRLRRTGELNEQITNPDNAFIVIDNLRVSPPPSGVTVYNVQAAKGTSECQIRCLADNTDTNAPTDSRTVVVYYRWLDLDPPNNEWTNAPMALADAGDGLGNGEAYELALPAQPQGEVLEYYVRCLFSGYAYQSPDYTGLGHSYASEALPAVITAVETQALAEATLFTLTVNGGSGSGTYTNGQQVAIVAAAEAGKLFASWAGATQCVADVLSPTTTVTMPAGDVAVTATYTNRLFSLTVNGGSGSGAYTNGEYVAIAAYTPPSGKSFDRWTGDTAFVQNVTASITWVMMRTNITLTAAYKDVYTLTVNGGSGSGAYTNGQSVAIAADAGTGKVFDRWTGDTAFVGSVTSPSTTVTMPAAAVTVTATYLDVYTLTVNGGSGSGTYTNEQRVAIVANPPSAGRAFAGWTGATQYAADPQAAATVVTMPPANIALTASYTNILYTLTVTGGSGGGSYTNGQVVAIAADVPENGTFLRWSGDTAYVASPASPNTTVTMPAANVSLAAVTASYTAVLPDNRFLHFNDYTATNPAVLSNATWLSHEGPLAPGIVNYIKALLPGTNHYHRMGWRLISCRAGTFGGYAGARYVPPYVTVPYYPAVASNLAANLRNDLGAMIDSPVFTNGIGTIYFEAINSQVQYPTEITVEVATNMFDLATGEVVGTLLPPSTNNLEYVWQTLDVLSLSAATSNDFVRYSNRLNFRDPAKMRIRRTGSVYSALPLDSAFTVVDNVRVSLPPSDVVVSKTELPFEPGYPAVATSLTVRCQVSNVDVAAPTDSRTVQVVYRWRFLNQVVGAWKTNTMASVAGTGDGQGNGELYQATLGASPYTEVGDLEYYFVCAFTGYQYQSPDFTKSGYTYLAEDLSPRTLRGDGEGRELSVRLRPCASRFKALSAEADQLEAPVPMSLVGDHEWRALVPVGGTGITNLTWRFKAEGEYVPGSGGSATGVTYWAGAAGHAEGQRMPFLGACVEADAGARLSVVVDDGHYVALTLNTETLQYSAVRAEYQNFNFWPAPITVFSESNGQDPKRCYLNTFDAWPANQEVIRLQAFAGIPASTNVFQNAAFFTLGPEFVAGSAAYVSERTLADNTANAPAGVSKFRNVAMRLKGGDGSLGLGYVHNRAATLPDGLKAVSFKARLTQQNDNYDICYYRNGFTNLNYLVRATARAVSAAGLSPQNPSVSLIGYYRDAENFYEYRLTQIRDTRDSATAVSDKMVRHELYRWQNGVPTRLGSLADMQTTVAPLLDTAITDVYPVEMCFFNESTGTRIRCRYKGMELINVIDTTFAHTCGTFGFLSSDCMASLSYVRTQATVTGAIGSGSETVMLEQNYNFTTAAWFLPSGRYQARNDVTPSGIYSFIPAQQIGVYLQPAAYGAGAEPEGADSSAWRLYKTVAVTNFTYQTVTVPLSSWQSQFVMLRAQSGAEDVVVDEFAVSSWRGRDNGLGGADDSQWVATESWVVSNASAEAHTVQLEHSRGDPSADQAIRSPFLETGLGMMEFDYRVLRAPAKLKVQVAFDQAMTDWQDAGSIVVSNAAGWTHGWVYVGTNAPGAFRLLNAREGAFTNAWVEINNATAWDEPAVSNCWRAYNAKITAADTNRVALDESKACFLNNDRLLEAVPPQPAFQPFLMSPELPRGLGRISFYARAYTNNQAATLRLYATTNGWNAPTNLWFEISRFENLTNGLYKRFSYEPQDGRAYDAVKLETGTSAGSRRVCLDEVVITEPVYASFDIQEVKLLSRSGDEVYEHPQPQEGEAIDVQARLANPQLTPSNVVFYLSYCVGTNAWGVDNWPPEQTVTRRMLPVEGDPTLYRTVPEGTPGVPAGEAGGIPGQSRDQVVQYVVWASYQGGVDLQVRQASFVNPPWYYGVDLNAWYGPSGWSPYYIVFASDQHVAAPAFSAADGSVFTNQAVIELTCPTVGAAIHYTTDGSEPTAESPRYSEPLLLGATTTLTAKAFRQGLLASDVVAARYTVLQTVAAPVLTPTNGTWFATLRKVTLSCGTAGAEIRYTLDGSEPTSESSLYTGAFNVSQTVTVQARAFKAGMVESAVARASYYRLPTLGEALDAPALAFTTGGDAAWFVQTNVTHDGADALQSGAITGGQTTWMETSVTGAGTLTFWWKASCEDDPDADDWDCVIFSVDGAEQRRLDGITEWQQVTCVLGAGAHTLRWEYRKDESLSEGADCAWVDQLSFSQGSCTTSTPVAVPFLWLDQYPGLLGAAGGDYEAAAQADVDGDGHTAWQEYVTGSVPTNRESVLRTRIGVSNGVPLITWTPDLGTVRVYTVSGRTNLLEGVWGDTNAATRFFRVRVSLPE